MDSADVGLREVTDPSELDARGPVVLGFFLARAGWWRDVESDLVRLAQRCPESVAVYRVDVDRAFWLATRFGVEKVPTVLVVRGGREIERLDWRITDADLTATFRRLTRT